MLKKTFAAALIALGFLAVYYVADPTRSGWMPQCPLHRMTGWSCPVCGLQRGIHALLHGRWVEALHFNWFLFGLSPLFLLIIFAHILPNDKRFHRLRHWLCSDAMYLTLGIAALIWLIIRNILHV